MCECDRRLCEEWIGHMEIDGPETETHDEQDGSGTDISEEPLK